MPELARVGSPGVRPTGTEKRTGVSCVLGEGGEGVGISPKKPIPRLCVGHRETGPVPRIYDLGCPEGAEVICRG